MIDLSYYIKVRSSISGCMMRDAKQFNCDRYLDCDSCLEDKIIEHDKHIIEQYKENIKLKDTIKNIHDSVSIQMYCKGIDEYKNALLKLIKDEQDTRYGYLNEMDIREVAEQVKKGVKYDRE